MRFKDANECLQAGLTAAVMLACLTNTEVIAPDRFKSIYEFEDAIWQKFHPEGKDQIGLTLPWGNAHGSSLPFRFRYGEITVWTGYNKHGKSEVLNHCMIDLCWQGDKALICSLEVAAPETYRKLIRMVMARRDVCPKEEREKFRDRCLRPLADKIWVYDHVGNAPLDEVLAVMLYGFQRYGIRQFVLDSFMRFEGLDGDGQEIWNKQKAFLDRLVEFSSRYGVHIHLVAHSRKPEDRKGEAAIPRRYNIMGSSYISNLPHNVVVIWRNRDKQNKLEEIYQRLAALWIRDCPNQPMPEWKRLMGGRPRKEQTALQPLWEKMIDTLEKLPQDEKDEFMARVKEHDAYFIVDAQRGGDGDTPVRHLWFHYDSLQFLEVSPWEEGDSRRLPRVYANETVSEMDEVL